MPLHSISTRTSVHFACVGLRKCGRTDERTNQRTYVCTCIPMYECMYPRTYVCSYVFTHLTIFNKIAIQARVQMDADKEAVRLSRVPV